MKKVPLSLLYGAIGILVTIVLYFLILENIFVEMICFITLVGVILAEVVVTALSYFSDGDPRKVAAAYTATLMIPISILLSVVYIVNFPEGYGSYLCWYIVMFLIILGICAAYWKNADNGTELQNAKSNMLDLRKHVKCVMIKENAKNFKKELDEIEEKLHFSNDAVISDMDVNIRRMLIELEKNIDNEGFNAADSIKEISSEIDRRNIFTKTTV